MSDKQLSLKGDIVFQQMFGKPSNAEITKHFISLVLEREISDIDLDVNKRMLGNTKKSKTGELDIRVKFNNGEDCNIEMQVSPYKYMNKRLLSYWSMMYREKIKKGQTYKLLKPSICILIADFKLKELKGINEYHTIWNLREKNNKNKILSQDIELHILEIPKIKENEILEDELALWLKFIENPKSKEVEEAMCKYKGSYFDQAREELAEFSEDPDFSVMVQRRVIRLLDENTFREEEREKGLRKGRKEAKKEMAKKLLKMKMPTDKIIEITELTEKEIRKIAK